MKRAGFIQAERVKEIDFGDESEHSGAVSFSPGEQGVRKTVEILRAWQIDLKGRLFNIPSIGFTASIKTSQANVRAMCFFVFRTSVLELGVDFRVDEVDSAGATKYLHTTDTGYVEDSSCGGSCEGQDNAEINLNQRVYLYIGLAAQCVPNTAQSGTVYGRRVYLDGLPGRISAIAII